MSRYACSFCRDIGWVDEPNYTDFGPSTQPAPCPVCRPVTEVNGGAGCLVLAVMAVVFVILMWGVR